mmetsp:Transcript_29206/g.45164  ORF Transcript_29206/g.45164 Transcript_29206/m.45164 type:complete len:82 (-) Transcript_29206:41-286(-)
MRYCLPRHLGRGRVEAVVVGAEEVEAEVVDAGVVEAVVEVEVFEFTRVYEISVDETQRVVSTGTVEYKEQFRFGSKSKIDR